MRISIDGVGLHGDLTVPAGSAGLVVFAHGSGSSRHSPRNKYVAGVLQQHRFATLLLDLLTPAEEEIDSRTARLRFDIELLAERLMCVAEWIGEQPNIASLRMGYFGASTGSAAALIAAARKPERVAAVVSRGGRPDLAEAYLAQVLAPTLLMVGGEDIPVIRMNEDAQRKMRAETRLEIVPGATHLFEEPGCLEKVAQLAAGWFETHIAAT